MKSELAAIGKEDLDSLKAFQPADWPDISKAYAFYSISSYCKPVRN